MGVRRARRAERQGLRVGRRLPSPGRLAREHASGALPRRGQGRGRVEGYGLYDISGNVWEWVSDWYRPDYYARLSAAGVARNPQGPDSPYDPAEPNERKRVHRGGSYLCTELYCTRYMVGTRGKGEVSTGSDHLGFRCVRPASAS